MSCEHKKGARGNGRKEKHFIVSLSRLGGNDQ